jgi:hypothetical protein
MGFGRGAGEASAMPRSSKENFILLVLFLAAALLVVTAAILIGYFSSERTHGSRSPYSRNTVPCRAPPVRSADTPASFVKIASGVGSLIILQK